MPIPKEIRRKFYGAVWERETHARIRERAGDRCESCWKPNGRIVETASGRRGTHLVMVWRRTGDSWRNRYGRLVRDPPWSLLGSVRRIRVVCTKAHLNHTPGDDRDENLRFCCQWCHLVYDREHHAETRAKRKDLKRPLLRLLMEES